MEEQAVVAPAGVGQGRQHLRPHGGVAAPVLVHAVGTHAQQKTVPGHHRITFRDERINSCRYFRHDGGYPMRLAPERQLIADHGRRMTGDRLAVTPAGHAYDILTPELVCVNHLDGSTVEGELAPTSELPFHQLIYAHTDAAAVVHTHSTAATVVSTVVDELPTIHYILAVMGGPIRVAPYATFGSQELADNVVAAIEGRSGVLLANHGAITYGPTIEVAYDRALYLEWVAEVWLRAHSLPGFSPRILGDAEMTEVYAKIQGSYGTTGRPREDLPTRTSWTARAAKRSP